MRVKVWVFLMTLISCNSDAAINTTLCDQTNELLDSNGNYLKTACLQAEAFNYSGAIENCKKHGMDLFEIDSDEVKHAHFSAAYERFPHYAGSTLWIRYESSESCYIMTNMFGHFRVESNDCNLRMWSFCEFNSSDLQEKSHGTSTSSTSSVILKLLCIIIIVGLLAFGILKAKDYYFYRY